MASHGGVRSVLDFSSGTAPPELLGDADPASDGELADR